jgi:hypothetical protein
MFARCGVALPKVEETLVQEVLIALAKLSQIDEDARSYDEELRDLPVTVAEMSANVATLEAAFEAEREQHQEAQDVRQAHREDMVSRQDSLARARTKANQASNVREMTAAEREVDTNRRLIREREEDASKLDTALEVAAQSLKDHEDKLAAFRTMFEESKKQAEDRIAEVEAMRAKVIKGRDEIVAVIPDRVVARYERVREHKGSGVCLIETPTCICHMAVGAQMFNDLQRGSDIHQCRSCSRYLVWAGWLPQADDSAESADASATESSAPEATVAEAHS